MRHAFIVACQIKSLATAIGAWRCSWHRPAKWMATRLRCLHGPSAEIKLKLHNGVVKPSGRMQTISEEPRACMARCAFGSVGENAAMSELGT